MHLLVRDQFVESMQHSDMNVWKMSSCRQTHVAISIWFIFSRLVPTFSSIDAVDLAFAATEIIFVSQVASGLISTTAPERDFP
mmetsp:Transcript_31800/g.51660  ORF Transcript_31800/g.51660 Transcript_31800/m.51660 type:complete len:83 (+) Transcript_31800:68-316(+)